MHTQRPERPAVLAHVAENVKRLRVEVGLSQLQLAERSDLSRRTVINLEAGDANVSLSGLDRIADALGSTFATLVAAPTAPREAIDEVVWRGAGPASLAVIRSSMPAHSEVQLWTWRLEPGERYEAEPDPPGWSETILVTAGRLLVERNDGSTELGPDDHVAFSSAQRYSYLAAAPHEPTYFTRVVSS